MHLRRPLTGAVTALITAVAAAAGTAAALLGAGTDPVLAETGFDRGPFVLGGVAFLLAGAIAVGVAYYAHHRAALRAETEAEPDRPEVADTGGAAGDPPGPDSPRQP